ncbi:DUF4932 domain-containing protein [uncultured Maricaulis sp.]|uniref:DUF4932 domain-containing protein n=1 Tax=uncultured Maricaulis sp. TaxID=174710 RepID=UPI0025E23D50|nr:DUF4932 domain-containing protein [uncultured Maricaulis sp.]
MKLVVVIGSVLGLMSSANISAQEASDSDFVIAVPETVELAFIIAALSELDRENGAQINRRSDYFADIAAYFEPYMDLPAIADLPPAFNLPRFAGNAADYAFNESGGLVEVDDSGSLWRDSDGDRFRAMLGELESFAMTSGFREFYRSRESLYSANIDATRQMVDPEDMTGWLVAEFSAREAPIRIYVSPLTGGLNWTTLYKPEQRMWLQAPDADNVAQSTVLDRMRFARSVFTELDHSYVNPVSAGMVDEVNAAFSDATVWASQQAISQYPTAELQFNEYMTWAVFLLYASDRLDAADYETLRPEVVNVMENRRGFRAFGAFTHALAERRADTGQRIEDLFPAMLDWSATWQANYVRPTKN